MKLSLITVVYNNEITIEETILSVLSQTYSPIEYIIIDGKSSDNTLSIINKYKDKVTAIISEPDKGIYDAMNKGIDMATGDLIGILNSDDIFIDNQILSKIVHEFKTRNIDALYGNISYFSTEKPGIIARYWQSKPYYSTFFDDGNVPPHPALFVKKSIYEAIGKYKIHYKIAADYEFMLRMLKIHDFKSYFLDETIVKMRLGGVSNKGLSSYIISTKELRNTWEINGLKYPLSLYMLRPYIKIKQLLFK